MHRTVTIAYIALKAPPRHGPCRSAFHPLDSDAGSRLDLSGRSAWGCFVCAAWANSQRGYGFRETPPQPPKLDGG